MNAYNKSIPDDDKQGAVLLPMFTAHNLRHTFCTRLCEQGVDVKIIQDVLGHADISTTLGIYADVDSEYRQKAFDSLADKFRVI